VRVAKTGGDWSTWGGILTDGIGRAGGGLVAERTLTVDDLTALPAPDAQAVIAYLTTFQRAAAK